MKHAITLTTLLMVSSDLFAGFRNVNELDSWFAKLMMTNLFFAMPRGKLR